MPVPPVTRMGGDVHRSAPFPVTSACISRVYSYDTIATEERDRWTSSDWLAERFEEHRARLRAVAYRMLGSLSEADDAVQEAWLRLSRADTERRREPRAAG